MLLAMPLALGLVACQTYAPPYGQAPYGYPETPPYLPELGAPLPASDGSYRAIGTEPFWDLTIGRDLVFTDRGTNVEVVEPTPPVRVAGAGQSYAGRRLRVAIERRGCSDGMSDRTYPDTVTVTVDGRAYRGCGGEAGFFDAVGENGEPRQGEHDLANTNWRVASINGRPLPPSGHYLTFAPDRLSGRLGCNTLGAAYRVTGSELRASGVATTRMACPDMQAEMQASRIMAQPMTLSESGDRLTLSNALGTIELIRAR